MNEMPDIVDGATGHPTSQRGAWLLYVVAMVVALGTNLANDLLEPIAGNSDAMQLLLPVVVIIPFFLLIGYAFVVPLLLFRTTLQRYVWSVILPAPLWTLFMLGAWLVFADSAGEMWAQMTACLMLALVGGFIPVCVVMGLGRWRLGIGATDAIPIGINDLLALITFAAVVLACIRQSDLFDERLPLAFVTLILVFYTLTGAVIFTSLLLAMRMTLNDDTRPLSRLNVLGIVLTVLMVAGVWSTLLIANDGVFAQSNHPVLRVILFTVVTWFAAAGMALLIGWWLRRHGFRLTTSATDR